MSTTKNSILRQKVIDHCLSATDRNYSIQDMLDKCNQALTDNGLPQVSSMNTIRSDIRSIETHYPEARIELIKVGRNKYYRYNNPDFSIYKLQFNSGEWESVLLALNLLNQISDHHQMEWVNRMKDHFALGSGIDLNRDFFVDFGENPYLRGRSYFEELFKAISNRRVLKMNYRSFKRDVPISFIIHPYYLKAYNKRWFLLGLSVKPGKPDKLLTFSLDRIESLECLDNVDYIDNSTIDFSEYFEDIIGVTKKDDVSLVKVVLAVSDSCWPYVRTKPIHGSQKEIKCPVSYEGASCHFIQLEIRPNKEFMDMMLAFGPDVEILSPEPLRVEIAAILRRTLKIYE